MQFLYQHQFNSDNTNYATTPNFYTIRYIKPNRHLTALAF